MYGPRQIRSVFEKNKWLILVVTWMTALWYLHMYRHAKEYNVAPDIKALRKVTTISDGGKESAQLKGSNEKLKVQKKNEKVKVKERNEKVEVKEKNESPEVKVKKYDVLLNSYMRSGSTLSGIVLGHRDDSFYLYEPLWKSARWTYWRGNSTLCRSDRYDCQHLEPGDTPKNLKFHGNTVARNGGSFVMSLNILRKFFDCQFNDFESQVFTTNIVMNIGGPSWDSMKQCVRQNSTPKACLNRIVPRLCRNASHRVTKVLRLTTDTLEPLLKERKNLKIFHLFRDPRAVINSRIQTKWYPTNSVKAILSNAKGLCDRMLYDFREGKKLLEKYPDQFKFLFYEDINEDPLKKVKAMYRFVGMSEDEKLYPKVRKLPVFSTTGSASKRVNDTAFWWRTSLNWTIVQGMEETCSDVYKEFGYKSIQSYDDFRNLSISSVSLPEQYLLEV